MKMMQQIQQEGDMPITHQPIEVQVTLPAEEEEETDSEAEEQARMMGYHQEEEDEEGSGGGDQTRISRPRVTAVQRAQSEIQPDTSSSNTRPRDPIQRSMSETRR
eukprot:sb/3477911/